MPNVAATNPLVESLATIVRDAVAEVLEDHLPTSQGPILDQTACAQALGVSLPTLRKLAAEGLPRFRVGDHWRYDIRDVLTFLKTREASK